MGRHGFDSFLPDSLPVCGDQSGIAYERLLEANPTVVCTQWGSRDLPDRLTQLALRNGWIIHDEKLLSLADIRRATIALDRLARGRPIMHAPSTMHGKADNISSTSSTIFKVSTSSGVYLTPDDSQPLRDLIELMDRTWSPMSPSQLPAGSVVLIGSLSPLAVLGPGSCHYELLSALGASHPSWLADKGAYVNVTGEDLAAISAPFYIIFDPLPPQRAAGEFAPIKPAERILGPGVVISGANARLITDPACLTPSTSMIRVGNQIRQALTQLAGPASYN